MRRPSWPALSPGGGGSGYSPSAAYTRGPINRSELFTRYDADCILPRFEANQRARGEDRDERQRGRRKAEVLSHKERPHARPVQPERVLLCGAVVRRGGVGDNKGFRSVSL